MYPMYTNNNLHTPLISGNHIGKSITIPSGSQGAVNVALDEVLHQEQVGDASARFFHGSLTLSPLAPSAVAKLFIRQ